MSKEKKIKSETFHANGKLLISGEYFILDGALALAIPTKYGQSLDIEYDSFPTNDFLWNSKDERGEIWFEVVFSRRNLSIIKTNDKNTAQTLQKILQVILDGNPSIFHHLKRITTKLDFPKNWGLGTSSTLIYNLANWANFNPFMLLNKTFGGSGYDIACAGVESPIFYKKEDNIPIIESCNFFPSFYKNLYFVYLEKKQNSRSGIALYRAKGGAKLELLDKISAISQKIADALSLEEFESLILQHETLVSLYLGIPKIKDSHFSDYWGTVKSLGAWGGDFVLVSSSKSEAITKAYFAKKSYPTFIRYNEMVKYLKIKE